MEVTAKQLHRYLIFKLPAAYLCGVKLVTLNDLESIVTVKHRWINQNPFKSIYFAVQSMAAELSTGALMIKKINESEQNIAMLITKHSGTFTKKAIGKIAFTCNDGNLIDEVLQRTIETGEGQTVLMKSIGINEEGIQVSSYEFEWSVKLRTKD